MPPFPWHFGGQSHHNLFVDPEEIRSFCERTGHKICLDISHSMMACNFYQWDFGHFLLQPMDGPDLGDAREAAIAYVMDHPKWRLSTQTHKVMGFR